LSAHHNWFDDYILQTRVGDAVVMGSAQIIRGFRNIQARTYGMDGEWTFKPSNNLSLPMTFAWVRGQNDTDHRHLPEIPAMEGTAAIRWEDGKEIPWFAELGARLVAEQDDIDRAFLEDATAGYQIFHFTGGARFHAGKHMVRLEAGIDNLFDQDYNDHLSREALNPDPSSGLREGDEVPGAGRTFWIKVRWEF
jgi:iron complex outermembrane receptor protein